MADLDDMEMVECPICGRRCPRDFYPLCSCGAEKEKKGVEKKKAVKPKRVKKA